MRVSSALNYAFAWGVRRWPSSYDPRRAFQRVQPGQRGLPTRTRRALRWPEYRLGPPRSGIQPTGYHHSRPTSQPGRGGVVLRLSYPVGCGREASAGVEDPVPQPGNAVTTRYGRAGVNDPGHTPVQPPNGGLSPIVPASSHPRGEISPRYRCKDIFRPRKHESELLTPANLGSDTQSDNFSRHRESSNFMNPLYD